MMGASKVDEDAVLAKHDARVRELARDITQYAVVAAGGDTRVLISAVTAAFLSMVNALHRGDRVEAAETLEAMAKGVRDGG